MSTPQTNRTSLSVDALKQGILEHLVYSLGQLPEVANKRCYYKAVALAVRDRLQHHWTNTTQNYLASQAKIVCYFSAEFLIGPQLGSGLVNLDM